MPLTVSNLRNKTDKELIELAREWNVMRTDEEMFSLGLTLAARLETANIERPSAAAAEIALQAAAADWDSYSPDLGDHPC